MLIGVTFTNNGADWTGLDPLPVIDIYDLSDDSKVISAAFMQEIGGGGYDYTFAAYDPSKDYYWKIDGGAAITNNKERYRRGWSGLAGAVPDAQAGVNGGLPTVDANDRIAGIQGTKNILDDMNDVSAVQVNAAAVVALVDYGGPTKAEMDAGHGLLATEVKQDIIDTNVDDIKAVTDNLPNAGALTDIIDVLALLKTIETKRWKIDTILKQLILYDNDNATPLYTFDLKDADGNAVSVNPMERVPV